MRRTTLNAADPTPPSLSPRESKRRGEIIAENKAETYAEIINRAAEVDGRRQAQIAQQTEALTDFVAFIEERGLMAEYVVWKDGRHVG